MALHRLESFKLELQDMIAWVVDHIADSKDEYYEFFHHL